MDRLYQMTLERKMGSVFTSVIEINLVVIRLVYCKNLLYILLCAHIDGIS